MSGSGQSLVLLVLLGIPLPAQVASRAEEMEAARQEKAKQPALDDTSKLEQTLVAIKEKKLVERITAGVAGFRVKFGGLASGSGFALGPEYLRRDLADGGVIVRASASASAKKYQLFDVQLTFPKLARQ